MAKLQHLSRSGDFGNITNFRLDCGFWFFNGYDHPDQRGSWNYKAAEGGGLVRDTYPTARAGRQCAVSVATISSGRLRRKGTLKQ